jgi:hypothetical protein
MKERNWSHIASWEITNNNISWVRFLKFLEHFSLHLFSFGCLNLLAPRPVYKTNVFLLSTPLQSLGNSI